MALDTVFKVMGIIAAATVIYVALAHSTWLDTQTERQESRDQRAERLVQIGDDALSVNDRSMASHAYGRALSISPESTEVREKQARLLSESMLANPVVDSAEQRLELQLQLSESLLNDALENGETIRVAYAKVLIDRGHLDIAATHLKQVLETDPKHPDAQLYLGDTYLRKKEWSNARSTIQKSLDERPNHGLSHYAMGLAFVGLENWSEAARHLERASVLQEDGDIYAELGRVRMAQNKTDLAEAAFAKARALGVRTVNVLVGHAETLRLNGRTAEALALYVAAYQQKAKPAFLSRIGQMQITLKEYEAAQATYSTLRKIQKDNPDPACRLGYIYSQLGQLNPAKNAYEWCQRKSAGRAEFKALEEMAIGELARLAESETPATQK